MKGGDSPMGDEPEVEDEESKPMGKGPKLAFDGFAECAGIPPEERDEAYKALRAFVVAIVSDEGV